MKKFLILILLFQITACERIARQQRPAFMRSHVSDNPEYQQGYDHGCESGMATYGTAINKLFNTFYQDYNMMSNEHYNAAWHEGFNYCRHYNYKWQTNDWTAN